MVTPTGHDSAPFTVPDPPPQRPKIWKSYLLGAVIFPAGIILALVQASKAHKFGFSRARYLAAAGVVAAAWIGLIGTIAGTTAGAASYQAPAAAPVASAPAAAPATQAPAPAKTVYVQEAPAGQPAAPAAPVLTDCGNYLYVNADTSCSFAQNVEADYTGLGPDYASSPVTGLNYTMNCVAGTDNEGGSGQSVECTGGDNAYVMWPAN